MAQSHVCALGEADRGAHLGADDASHLVAAAVVGVGQAPNHGDSFGRFATAPNRGVEGRACRGDSTVDVRDGCRIDFGDDLFGVRRYH